MTRKNNWICGNKECEQTNLFTTEWCVYCGQVKPKVMTETIGGETKTYKEWSKELGITNNIARYLSTLKKQK